MMLDMDTWMTRFLAALEKTFTGRVWFVGLQGSRARGEAREESDIDVVVVLDRLTAADIARYSAMLEALPARPLICGFLSGREELVHWRASDLFQFCHDTTAYKGTLDDVLALVDEAAVREAVHLGACNIYHGCVHNMVHEKDAVILADLYKAALFVAQAIVYLETGRYVHSSDALRAAAAPEERMILETAQAFKEKKPVCFETASEMLFQWAQRWIVEMG